MEIFDNIEFYGRFERFSGHSLGGAIAELVTMKVLGGELGDLDMRGDRLQCFVFGAPPCFRRQEKIEIDEKHVKLHAELQKHVFSFVNGNDVVPSACVGTVKKLLKSLRYDVGNRGKLIFPSRFSYSYFWVHHCAEGRGLINGGSDLIFRNTP